MAIANWEINKSNDLVDVSLEIDKPIGAGSLHIKTISNSLASLRIADPTNRAYSKGRVSTLLKPIRLNEDNTSQSFIGVCGMVSRLEIQFSGSCYAAGILNDQWVILKIKNKNVSVLAHSKKHLPQINKIQAMEFEWIYDPLELNGVRVVLRVSEDEFLTNLETICTYIDKESPLRESKGEGLLVCGSSEALFAKTSIWELVPV